MRIFKDLSKKVGENVIFLLLFLLLISFLRNFLEWYASEGHYFGLIFPELINTYTYVLLMVFPEFFILNLLLHGDIRQFRRIIQEGAIFLSILFLIIVFFNTIFNYRFLELPIWYSFPLLLYPHYGPIGINIAFIIMIFYFPYWLKRIYPLKYVSIFGRVLLLYSVHYLLYYQLTMAWFFNGMKNQAEFIPRVNLWSISFLLPVLILSPWIIRDYSISKSDKRVFAVFYVFLIFLLIWLAMNVSLPASEENEDFSLEFDKSFWNFYFLVLRDEYRNPYYGIILSFDGPQGKTTSARFVNQQGELLNFATSHRTPAKGMEMISFVSDKPELSIASSLLYSELIIDSGEARAQISCNSLGSPFWWNENRAEDFESQFSKIRGYDDFVNYKVLLSSNEGDLDLSGSGIHELLQVDSLSLSWEKEYFFYFITDQYRGLYLQYDDFIDGVVFDSVDLGGRKIRKFTISEGEETVVELETDDRLFKFLFETEITLNPYGEKTVYSPGCDCYRDIIHNIYKLKTGEVIFKENMLSSSVNQGYFQLETLKTDN